MFLGRSRKHTYPSAHSASRLAASIPLGFAGLGSAAAQISKGHSQPQSICAISTSQVMLLLRSSLLNTAMLKIFVEMGMLL